MLRNIRTAFLAMTLPFLFVSCETMDGKSGPDADQISQESNVVGSIEKYDNFPSKNIPPRRVDVWLPPDFDPESSSRYNVLYMHDGENLFDSQHSKYSGEEWGMDETATRLMQSGDIPPVIIVGIWSTEDRLFELMPQKSVTEDQMIRIRDAYEEIPDDQPFTGDSYLKFIVEELKPFVDKTYPTLTARKNSFIMGSSMGGLASCNAIVEFPEIFAGAGCVSSHFPIGNGAVVDYFRRAFPASGRHKIYFDYGTQTLDATYEPYQKKMDEVMLAKGYRHGHDWITKKFEGHDHSEVAWKKRVHEPLKFLMGRDEKKPFDTGL